MSQFDTHDALSTTETPFSAGAAAEIPRARTILLDQDQFRALLERLARQSGCKAELARRLDVSGQFIGDLIAGKKNPGPKLLSRLGARPCPMIEIDVEILSGGGNGS